MKITLRVWTAESVLVCSRGYQVRIFTKGDRLHKLLIFNRNRYIRLRKTILCLGPLRRAPNFGAVMFLFAENRLMIN
jgi:hypothetical protein